jgi:PAS domain S-box-containing protein
MFDALGHAVFDRYPAPTFVVDDDLRVVLLNGSARSMLGVGIESVRGRRGGEALRCVHSYEPGGCGRQRPCADCVIRTSINTALEHRATHRARSFLRLRRDEGDVDVCALVSASRIDHAGKPHVVLTLEDVSDVHLKDEVLRAEAALREALERAATLSRLPEENPDPVLRVGRDLDLLYANPAARSALAGLGLSLFHPVPPAIADPVRQAHASGRPCRADLSCGDRVFSLSFCPAGAEVNVYGDDVTDRQRAYDELAAEKDRLAVTLRSIGDGVIVTDELGRVTMLNGVAEELTGWKGSESAGADIHDVFEIVHEDTRAPAANPVDRALREGRVVGLANHTALVARDRTERPIADSAGPIRDAAGRIVGAVLVFRDQTRERRAEQALRDSEARVRRKLESILSPEGNIAALQLGDILDTTAVQSLMDEFNKVSGIPLAVLDTDGKVLVGAGWQDVCTRFHRVHPETCKHCIESDTQLSAGVRLGDIKLYKCKNNMWDAATPIVVDGHHLGNVFAGQFFFEDEVPDYELFQAQAVRYGFDPDAYLGALGAAPRLSRDKVAAGMAFLLKFAGMLSGLSFSNIKLARSVTEREVLMTALRGKTAQLEETDRRKDEFLALLSHELRNPLAPIRNSVYILDHAAPGTERASRAQRVIARQVEHLTRLVDDLLDVTRVARGKVELRRTRTDLRELILHAADDFRTVIEERGILFHVAVPAQKVWAEVDGARITQVVGNLLHNASKFTDRGGEVSLSLTAAGDVAEIDVRDSGAGIDPALLSSVFEAFVQGDRSLARSSGGLGLGLALVKGITELHRGTVRADSAGIGKGARFTVSLPIPRTDTVQEDARAPLDRCTAPRRVLIVDDNRDAALSMAEIVEMLGHEAEVAYDGPTALEKARESSPDVILCDIGLPGMSGFEVAKELRASGYRTRLFAISGYAQPEDVQRTIEAGFDGHVAKPCDASQVARLLAT